MSSVFDRLREGLPPVLWAFTATGLAMLVSFFGFFHWMPFAGVMFATLLLRPHREWPVWYVLFCCATLAQSVIVAYITYGGLSEMYAQHGLSLLLIGNALHPLLAMAAVYHVQRLGLRGHQAVLAAAWRRVDGTKSTMDLMPPLRGRRSSSRSR